MRAKRFTTYPFANINQSEDRRSDEKIRLFDGKSRESYFKSLEEAQQNLGLELEKKVV